MPENDVGLKDADLSDMNFWNTFLFILRTESSRATEIFLGAWCVIYGLFVTFPGSQTYNTSTIYNRLVLAHVAPIFVGGPLLFIGLVQLYAVLGRQSKLRLMTCRALMVVSVMLVMLFGSSGGFWAPAWAFWTVYATFATWCLWRNAPAKGDSKGKRTRLALLPEIVPRGSEQEEC